MWAEGRHDLKGLGSSVKHESPPLYVHAHALASICPSTKDAKSEHGVIDASLCDGQDPLECDARPRRHPRCILRLRDGSGNSKIAVIGSVSLAVRRSQEAPEWSDDTSR
jgi:hypothetical protein